MSKITDYVFNAKVGIISLMTFFNVAAGHAQNKQQQVVTQQPDNEIVQLSSDEPWMTDDFKNELAALNKKFETKGVRLNAVTNKGNANVITRGVQGSVRTGASKRGNNTVKVVDVLGKGVRTVYDVKARNAKQAERQAQYQVDYDRQYDNLEKKHKRRAEQASRKEAKATGADVQQQQDTKLYKNYVAECTKNKVRAMSKEDYLASLQQDSAEKTTTSTSTYTPDDGVAPVGERAKRYAAKQGQAPK